MRAAVSVSRRAAWLLCAAVALTGCQSCAHRKEVKVENALNATPAQPRTVAIAYRSWLGSSQALTAGADELLFATGRVQPVGGAMFWYVEPNTPRRFLVVNGVAVKTAMTIAELQGMLRAIEERLNDGQPARVGGLLKADLLWVEGTQIDSPTLKLPNPDVLGTDWGLEAFVAAAEDPFADACKGSNESKTFCYEVGGKYRSTSRTNAREEHPDLWFVDKSTEAELVFGGVAVETNEDILAQAAAVLALTGCVHRTPPTARWDDHHVGEYAQGILEKVRSTEFVPLEAAVRADAGVNATVESWLDAVRSTAAQAGITVARSVVFSVGAGRIRGAILGAKTSGPPSGPLPPLPPVRSVDVQRGGVPLDPARQPQGWIVELHVARPLAPGAHP